MLYIGADHAGYFAKEKLKKWLLKKKVNFKDLGALEFNPKDDYPDYADKVAKAVIKNQTNKGILICGSGFGMAIAANKIKGIRAIAPYDSYTAKMSRLHNNANILALRGRGFSQKKIISITNTWLNTSFSNQHRHKIRIKKVNELK